MALRALLFSKNPETASSLASVLAEAGIRAEVSADIFTALDKGTKQAFSCVIVDWAEQPEAGFLLKRARESEPNRRAVVIAIVDHEPTPDQVREQRLDHLIYRPISADEARSVLGKARQQMLVQSNVYAPEVRPTGTGENSASPDEEQADPNLLGVADELPDQHEGGREAVAPKSESVERADTEEVPVEEPAFQFARPRRFDRYFHPVAAVALLIAALVLFARSREAFSYLAHTPEGAAHVLRESISELFFSGRSGAVPVGSAATDAQQDAYYRRRPTSSASQLTTVGVVNGEVTIPDSLQRLRRAGDFPLPTPQLVRSEAAAPVRVYNRVPDSIRSSPPIATPIIVAVTPAQIMPVSTPPPPLPQVSEPVSVSEEIMRALAIQTPAPAYPADALAQKLQGPVVLQALIGRDGTVQDLKLVHGYFLLGKAAIATVKHWRFQPYNFNGHPAAAQTTLTVNFVHPGM
jgi:TonB family protein